MDRFIQLGADMAKLWSKYSGQYLSGMGKTIVLALLCTAVGALIGLICGILQTIPSTKQDNMVKRVVLAIVRFIVRIYVEVFRGTPMILQAVFVHYALPYFTSNAVRFDNLGLRLPGGLHQHRRLHGGVGPRRHPLHSRGPD